MKHIINQLNNVLCEGAPQYNTDSRNTETFSLLALLSILLASLSCRFLRNHFPSKALLNLK